MAEFGWAACLALRPYVAAAERALTARVPTAVHHTTLDALIGGARGRLLPAAFYAKGFGQAGMYAALAERLAWYASCAQASSDEHITELAWPAHWQRPQPVTTADVRMAKLLPTDWAALLRRERAAPASKSLQLEAAFPSPSGLMPWMPAACSEARVQLVLPSNVLPARSGSCASSTSTQLSWTGTDVVRALNHCQAVAVILAGTGEHGFLRRRCIVAEPLAAAGIASIILESPFYGSRKPAGQVASRLLHLADLPLLGGATVDEALSLCASLRAAGMTQPLVATGNSMAGLHSAMVAGLLPAPLAVASWLGPPSAEPVFTRGLLASAVKWQGLATDAFARPNELQAAAAAACGAVGRIDAHGLESQAASKTRAAAALHAVPVPSAQTWARPVTSSASLRALPGTRWVGSLLGSARRRRTSSSNTVSSAHDTASQASSVPTPTFDPEAGKAAAYKLLSDFLGVTELYRVPAPAVPTAAHFAIAQHDLYVPLDAVDWRWEAVSKAWPGAHVHQLRGGHVSATLFPVEGASHPDLVLTALRDLASDASAIRA